MHGQWFLGLLLSWLCVEAAIDTALSAAQLHLMHPVDGTVVGLPVRFACRLSVPTAQELHELDEGRTSICVEVDGKRVLCEALDLSSVAITLDDLQLGSHTARLLLVPSDQESRLGFGCTAEVAFSVVEQDELRKQMQLLHLRHVHEDLLTWARMNEALALNHATVEQSVHAVGQSAVPPPRPRVGADENDHVLVVGVKTSVVDGFHYRQAIRETWAQKRSLFAGIEVLFIGCRPNATTTTTAQYHAIELERTYFGDLLTHELDCADSYNDLVRKTTEFLHFVTFTRDPLLVPKYVMLTDDDIYLRVNDLAMSIYQRAPRSRYYAGQVWAEQFGYPMPPIRDPTHKNYLTMDQYPMSELPPYAFGPHYVLSIDCARFIAKNRHQLVGIGILEDVSVAFWMLTMQVHPEHSSALQNLRNHDCDSETLISYADLSTTGIRAIHANLQAQRSFCHGFNRTLWARLEPDHLII